jgi:ABC-type transporter Mla maintaining outer membrane lipid asymmetry permease subunit MlaE
MTDALGACSVDAVNFVVTTRVLSAVVVQDEINLISVSIIPRH